MTSITQNIRTARSRRAVPRTAILIVLVLLAASLLPAQTFNVLHSFTNGTDGSYLVAGV